MNLVKFEKFEAEPGWLLIKDFRQNDIKKVVKSIEVDIDLNKFVEQSGFKDILRKAFFDVSKNKIVFYNPGRPI